jgi:hypothetical protein
MPVDFEASDAIDRRHREFEIVPGDHLLDAEVGGHQRLPPVRRRVLGGVNGEVRPVALDAAGEFLRRTRTHPQVTRVPTDDRVYGGER